MSKFKSKNLQPEKNYIVFNNETITPKNNVIVNNIPINYVYSNNNLKFCKDETNYDFFVIDAEATENLPVVCISFYSNIKKFNTIERGNFTLIIRKTIDENTTEKQISFNEIKLLENKFFVFDDLESDEKSKEILYELQIKNEKTAELSNISNKFIGIGV